MNQFNHLIWAAPIVPVLKRDKKTIHFCGDYRLTVKRAVTIDQHPILKIEDLLTKIAGGKYLDLSQAYQQLPLHEDYKQLIHIKAYLLTLICLLEFHLPLAFSNEQWKLYFRTFLMY